LHHIVRVTQIFGIISKIKIINPSKYLQICLA